MALTFGALFHPRCAKSFAVGGQCPPCRFIARRPAGIGRVDVDPALAPLQQVMLGQREEVIAAATIPVDDHLREVGAVAPQRVGVQVPLPADVWRPRRRCRRRGCAARDEQRRHDQRCDALAGDRAHLRTRARWPCDRHAVHALPPLGRNTLIAGRENEPGPIAQCRWFDRLWGIP